MSRFLLKVEFKNFSSFSVGVCLFFWMGGKGDGLSGVDVRCHVKTLTVLIDPCIGH